MVVGVGVQDTEFPGVVVRPVGTFSSSVDYHYKTMQCNVNLLNLIQVGITFANERGELADGCPTWQFNFKFDLTYVGGAALVSPRALPGRNPPFFHVLCTSHAVQQRHVRARQHRPAAPERHPVCSTPGARHRQRSVR